MIKSVMTLAAAVALLAGCEGNEANPPYGKPTNSEGKPVDQAMVKDPVCGMRIDSAKAKDHTHKGTKYYFCSAACHDAFEKTPEKYAPPQ